MKKLLKQIKQYWKLYKASLLGTKSDYWVGVDYARSETKHEESLQ